MKIEFTEDQLVTIRDKFIQSCKNNMYQGDRDSAEKDLEIINAIQDELVCEIYEDLVDLHLDDSDIDKYRHKRTVYKDEEHAIELLIMFAKSDEKVPSESLIKAINKHAYSITCSFNDKIRIIEYYRKAVNGLFILCMNLCTKEEMKKLDDMLDKQIKNLESIDCDSCIH